MNRDIKETMVADLRQLFETSQAGILLNYRGMTVEDFTNLRQSLRSNNAGVRVMKNRIAKLALQNTHFASMAEQLTEPRALVYANDVIPLAKVLKALLDKNESVEYVGGWLVNKADTRTIDITDLRKLADLPPVEVLQAQFLGLLQNIPTRLVCTLNGVASQLVRTLRAIEEQKGNA